ncbi:MAG: hypothetical protein HYZ83_08350 [Candidatus Omnitrophica bacterium]|nr:hypothetical protein [Candidatus Omnitrophota bacterium]
MKDSELLYLKFQKRFSTQKLLKRFPREKKRIVEVALLDVNQRLLREIIKEQKMFYRLGMLRRKFHRMRRLLKEKGTWRRWQHEGRPVNF